MEIASLEEELRQANIGFCVKNKNRQVVFQNPVCMGHCHDKTDAVCSSGCMGRVGAENLDSPLGQGTYLLKNTTTPGGNNCDAVVINTPDRIFTFLYAATPGKQSVTLVGAETLTKREEEIFDLILHGYSNQQIIDKLFISRSTLKTHINNIYRKLPEGERKALIKKRGYVASFRLLLRSCII